MGMHKFRPFTLLRPLKDLLARLISTEFTRRIVLYCSVALGGKHLSACFSGLEMMGVTTGN